MNRIPPKSHAALGLLVVGIAACATANRPISLVTGPGGLPISCVLPDCAIPGEFDSIDTAIFAGLEQLRKQPDWRIREYGGCVFEVRLGVYRVSYPARLADDEASRRRCVTPPAPEGTRIVADFHNHPTREGFSRIDITSIPEVPHYLLAPSGAIYRYTPATRMTARWEGGRWLPV